MAELGNLEVGIKGNISDLQANLKKGQASVNDFANKTAAATSKVNASFKSLSGTSIFNLTERLRELQNAVFTEKDRAKIKLYNAEIASTEKQLKALQTTGTSSMGAIGAGAGKAFGALRNIAYLLPGIGIAGLLSFPVEPIAKYVGELLKAKGALNEVQKAAKAYNEALGGGKEEYTKAVSEVENLRIAFRQAREGVITKGEALKLYNETLGKTTGKVNDLVTAEAALNKNAEAYIKFTFLKAVANTALTKSADKMFEQLVEARKEFVPTKTNTTDIFGMKLDPKFLKERENAERRAFTAAKMRRAADANDQVLTFSKIREESLAQAEAFAKEFGFDFNGIKEPDAATVKDKLVKPFKKIRFTPEDIEFIDPEQFGRDIEKAFEKIQGQSQVIYKPTVKIEPSVSTDNLLDLQVDEATAFLLGQGYTQAFVDGLLYPDLFALQKKAAAALDAFSQDVSNRLTDLRDMTATGIAEGLGNVLSGQGFGDAFKPMFLALANGITELGKAAIKFGLAKKALSVAFKSLNPGVAIAAGFALVALGTVIKNKLSKGVPGFANGVNNFSGGLAMVGERGPELVNLPRGSDVIPNHALGSLSGGSMEHVIYGRIENDHIYLSNQRAAQRRGRQG